MHLVVDSPMGRLVHSFAPGSVFICAGQDVIPRPSSILRHATLCPAGAAWHVGAVQMHGWLQGAAAGRWGLFVQRHVCPLAACGPQ